MRFQQTITGGVCALLSSVAGLAADPACPPLDDAAQSKLVDYVQKKYKTAGNVAIRLTQSSFVADTCFRKLHFSAVDSSKPFKLDLIASPDLRFLTRELFDSNLDPAIEEAQKRQALAASLTTGDAPAMGPKDAPVTMVVFSDFECPFCAQLGTGLASQILPGHESQVRIVFHNFPLAMHPWAQAAAEAAMCAARQDAKYFWNFHDYLFEHQREIRLQNLDSMLSDYGASLKEFDVEAYRQCKEKNGAAAGVERDIALAAKLGINSTPTIFINGQRLSGYRLEQVQTLIRELTSSAEPSGQR